MKKAEITGADFKKLVMIDSGRSKIFSFNQSGEVDFELPTLGAGFDVWMLPDGNYLYCHLGPENHGSRAVTPENEIITEYITSSEVFTCQPLDGGYILTGELTEKRITISSPSGKLEKIIPVKSEVSGHEVMRAARRTKNGDYLVVHPGDRVIRRYDSYGKVIWEAPTRNDTFGVIEQENGNILYTAQTAVAELDLCGNEIWSFTKEDAPELGIHWLTGFHLLESGNIAVCNWLGHGMEGTGSPLFEISRDKKVVWSLKAPEFTSDPANLQVIEANMQNTINNIMK